MAAGFAALPMLLHVLVVPATGAPEPPTPQVRTGDPASGPPVPPPAAPAERLLDERLARGDLDEEEYLARRDLLRS
jgi:putative membrane protein